MIRYTVVWPKQVLDEVAEIWMNAEDRAGVTATIESIDGELREDASGKGVELSEGLRAITAPPLRVLFAVRQEDRIVEIALVRHVG